MGGKPFFLIIAVSYALFLGVLLLPDRAHAEFYSYEDSSGTLIFVDDLSKIPAQYRDRKQVRKEAYDDLPENERALLLEKERAERAAMRHRESEQQEMSRQRRLAEERKAFQEQLKELLTTKVSIIGRQIFVPVKIGNGSVEIEVMLLLDTGATSSVITPEAAARLNIEDAGTARVSVVGGRVMNVKKAVLGYMEVGPIKRPDQEVIIVRQRSGEFGDGLLGMSFLGGLKYTIDYKAQTINWLP